MSNVQEPRRTPRRASGRQRRADIIEATLRVMRREGLRALSHRVIAREAGVPLAATTYYFTDLEELVTEAFLHWWAGQQAHVEAVDARVRGLLDAAGPGGPPVEQVASAVADYLREQVVSLRADRELESAFQHEALRLPRLGEAVAAQQEAQLSLLARIHEAIGSPSPQLDARISHGVLLGLENAALLAAGRGKASVPVQEVLLRYLRAIWPAGITK